jgi:hypothetical protein
MLQRMRATRAVLRRKVRTLDVHEGNCVRRTSTFGARARDRPQGGNHALLRRRHDGRRKRGDPLSELNIDERGDVRRVGRCGIDIVAAKTVHLEINQTGRQPHLFIATSRTNGPDHSVVDDDSDRRSRFGVASREFCGHHVACLHWFHGNAQI